MLTASDDPRWRSRYYSTGGARRRFLDAGSGPRALLCLHGIPSHHVIWREVIAALPPTIRAIAPDVLRHRVLPSYEATAEGWDGDRLVKALLDVVPLP